ncbi:MAG: Zn-ribbon domain-containing OB-fold protein [Sporichthyaceae bacterium]
MTTVHVADDLFREDPHGVALVGTRCSGCGSHYFPRSLSCRHPECDDKTVDEVLMGRRGTLFSWTVQRYRPPAPFQVDDWTPYVIGVVDLPEGLRVLAMITGCTADELRIDMPLELVTKVLARDEDTATVTYAYAPAGGSA